MWVRVGVRLRVEFGVEHDQGVGTLNTIRLVLLRAKKTSLTHFQRVTRFDNILFPNTRKLLQAHTLVSVFSSLQRKTHVDTGFDQETFKPLHPRLPKPPQLSLIPRHEPTPKPQIAAHPDLFGTRPFRSEPGEGGGRWDRVERHVDQGRDTARYGGECAGTETFPGGTTRLVQVDVGARKVSVCACALGRWVGDKNGTYSIRPGSKIFPCSISHALAFSSSL